MQAKAQGTAPALVQSLSPCLCWQLSGLSPGQWPAELGAFEPVGLGSLKPEQAEFVWGQAWEVVPFRGFVPLCGQGSFWAGCDNLLGPGARLSLPPLGEQRAGRRKFREKFENLLLWPQIEPPFSVACQSWCWAGGHQCRTILVWTNSPITPGCGTCRVCPSNSQHTQGGHTSSSCTHLSFCLWALLSPRLRAGGGSGEPQPQSLLPWLVPVCSHRSCCSHPMILHVEPVSDQTFNLEGKAKENSGELNYLLLHTIIWHNTAQQ